MKKWLIGCLMLLLFITTTAYAGHIKTDGSMCQSEAYICMGSENKTETQHRMQCRICGEWMWEKHWAEDKDKATCKKQARCGLCGIKYGSLAEHKFSKATCVAKATCTVCKLETGEVDPDNHDLEQHAAKAPTCTEIGWEAYKTCKRDGCNYTTYKEIPALKHDLAHHDAKAATCTEIGWNEYDTCTRCDYSTYKEIPALNHDLEPHAAQAPTCTEIGWEAGRICRREGCKDTTYEEISALKHDLVHHDAKTPTCTEIGWDAYDTCKREGCKYTTYKEISALNHDLENHAAKAPTCTEIGWDAYVTCKRDGCKYTTYEEISALNHDLEDHAAKAPTCTEIGWDAYVTCKRDGCDYTTYVELPALGHDYQKTVVQPTCETGGYTRYTCARCADTYTEKPVKKLLHWYGEWSPNGDDTHSADCRREGCKHTGKVECKTFEYRLLFADAEEYVFELCPVCGEVSDGARLELVEEAAAKAEHLPQGEPVLRLNELQNGERILSVGFEYSGKLTQPTEPVEIHLPAELLKGYTLHILAADDTETELPFTVTEDTATFTLTFDAQDEIPVRTLHLVPVQ